MMTNELPGMMSLKAIGIVRNGIRQPMGQGWGEIVSDIVIDGSLTEALDNLDGFSHIILIYQFHKSNGYDLILTPFMDDKPHGVFATRAPRRPNPLGISIVKLESIEARILHVCGIDVLNGTPLLDIKPYIPAFDQQINVRSGWLEDKGIDVSSVTADTRFGC